MSSEDWPFASPYADPRSFSLVIRGGDDGYACYTKGNNFIVVSATVTQGYVDGKPLKAVADSVLTNTIYSWSYKLPCSTSNENVS
jgi:hypothetical protein